MKLICTAAFLMVAFARPLIAQINTPGYTPPALEETVFETISRADSRNKNLRLRGLPLNASSATPVDFESHVIEEGVFISCMTMAMLMMEKPGRYYLHIVKAYSGNTYVSSCGLALRN